MVDAAPDSQQVDAWVTQVSPLMIKTRGALTSCPARTLAGQTYTLAAKVQATLHTPSLPTVQGVVT